MWGDRERIEEEVTTQQILQGDKRSWKLITVHGNKYTGMVIITLGLSKRLFPGV